MTEEYPKQPKEDYEFPSNHFTKLEKYDLEDQRYDNRRRDLYTQLSRTTDLPAGRVGEINHFLKEGKVGLARELTEEILEE